MYYFQLLKQIFTRENILRCILFTALPSFLFYAVSLLVLSEAGFEVIEILRDPAQQSGQSSFLGFLSNVGIWLWVSSAAICFFASAATSKESCGEYKELLILVGMLSMLLAIDDFFMIHDRYVSQRLCYLVYALLAGSLLLRHCTRIVRVDGFSFLLAGFLLGASIFTDLIQGHIPLSYAQIQIVEEGFKFGGASIWLYFCSRTASKHLSLRTS